MVILLKCWHLFPVIFNLLNKCLDHSVKDSSTDKYTTVQLLNFLCNISVDLSVVFATVAWKRQNYRMPGHHVGGIVVLIQLAVQDIRQTLTL